MSKPALCEHKYRRDVETCPHCDLNEAEEALEAAQEAAENYWHAWQGAATYWKDKVHRLQMDLCEANDYSEYLQDQLKKEES